MADLAPLRGWRYNPEKVKDLGRVVAPPYDVIDPHFQRTLYERHPWNVIRLILNEILPEDDDRDNRYTRAAMHLNGWRSEGILSRDERPVIYLYQQRFNGPSARHLERKGFIALLRLEAFNKGTVFPHEETFLKHRVDRLCLMRTCRAHFNPILSMYPDPGAEVDSLLETPPGPPVAQVIDDMGVEHELRILMDPDQIRAIGQAMKKRPIFIADGHHRYETCLKYRDEREMENGPLDPDDPMQWTLMYFTPMEREGLIIYPTHKLVNGIQGLSPSVLIGGLAKDFDLQSLPFDTMNEQRVRGLFLRRLYEEGRSHSAIGMAISGQHHYWLLTPRDPESLAGRLSHLHECLRGISVTLLHEIIFRGYLGIDVADSKNQQLVCLHDADQSLDEVLKGRVQVGFVMNPTRIEDLKAVARARCKMPQKATYFYPKLLSGLVANVMEPEERIEPI